MPLLRMAARTAVVAGTATAVSGRVARRQNQRWAGQQEQEQQQYAPAEAPPEAAPPAEPEEDPMEQLAKLGKLHADGVLTDEEFAVAKSKILNG